VNLRPERPRLGDVLVDLRLIERAQLDAALEEQRASGKRLARILAERRLVDEERLAKAVANRLGLEAVNVGALRIHERVLGLIPAAVATKHAVLPVAIKRTNNVEVLYLLMVDPLDGEAVAEVQRVTGRSVRVLVGTVSDVEQAIESHYRRIPGPPSASVVPTSSALPTSPSVPRPLPSQPASSGGGRPTTSPTAVPTRRAEPTPVPGPARSPAPLTPPPRSGPEPQRMQRGAIASAPGVTPVARPDLAGAGVLPQTVASASGVSLSRAATAVPRFEFREPPAMFRDAPPGGEHGNPRPEDRTLFDAVERATHVEGERAAGSPAAAVAPVASRPPLASPTTLPASFGGSERPAPRAAPEPADPARARASAEARHGPIEAPSSASTELLQRDWDQAMDSLADDDAWPSARPSLSAAASGAGLRSVAADGSTVAPAVEPSRSGWSASSHGLEPEEIATSQLELDEHELPALFGLPPASAPPSASSPPRPEVGPRALVAPEAGRRPATGPVMVAASSRRPAPSESRPAPERVMASTMEVPIEFDERSHPFGVPSSVEIPTGLERTGIIPAIDWEQDGFVPPPLAHPPGAELRGLVGSADIPLSDAAVRARSLDARALPDEPHDELAAIEEVALEPVDDDEFEALDAQAAGQFPGATRDRDQHEAEREPSENVPHAVEEAAADAARRVASDPPRPAGAPSTLEDARRELPPVEAARLTSLLEPEAISDSQPTGASARPRAAEPPFAALLEQAPRAPAPEPPSPSSRPQVRSGPRTDPLPDDEPTPARGGPPRAMVLSQLDPPGGRAPEPGAAKPRAEQGELDAATATVRALVAGDSLTSAERAQLVLALGRLLLRQGALDEAELIAELRR
jgi:hypothetical protein